MALPVIVKGGESLPNNTYGFEVEFCSHDNSVFAFTHVDTGLLTIQTQQGNVVWHIETDSGNVLELVTTPIPFDTIEHAYAFKNALTQILTASVKNALTYTEWAGNIAIQLGPLLSQIYGESQLVFTFSPYNDVNPQVNVNNIDDGINIPAARLRLNRNQLNWNNYVGSTVLAQSQKDWFSGYSSQVNLPMSVSGYFMYAIGTKFPRAQARFAAIVNDLDTLQEVSTEKLEKQIWYWYWQNVEFTAFVMYARRIWGEAVYGFIRSLLPDDHAPFLSGLNKLPLTNDDILVDFETYENVTSVLETIYNTQKAPLNEVVVRQMAVLYVTVCKMLTGALGSLSERNQLHLQQMAWDSGSTEVMPPQPGEANEIMAMRRWLEYHSSMKDLTSLWFKGALLDVNAKENLFYALRNNHAQNEFLPSGWNGILGSFLSVMRSERWAQGRTYADLLEEMEPNVLAERIAVIENNYNLLVNGWGDQVPAFNLPDRNQRPFLGYNQNPNSSWEGRYDTMISAIPPHGNIQTYTYLIEHRNN